MNRFILDPYVFTDFRETYRAAVTFRFDQSIYQLVLQFTQTSGAPFRDGKP
jgi:hypothetical protein